MVHNSKMDLLFLQSVLDYNSETGKFYWKVKTKNTKIGQEAGTLSDTGYIRITINKIKFKAHRLAWLFYYGEAPNDVIDHINCCRTDNKITNLRVVTQSVNNRNRITNTYDTGIRLMPSGNYRASIKVNDKSIHLGTFKIKQEAIDIRNKFIEDNKL